MQLKISKTLEGLIARSAFNTTKAGISHSLKDFLALELLREEGSLAFQLLSARLRDWELYQIRLRIEHEIRDGGSRAGNCSPEEFFRSFADELRTKSENTRSITTGHALLAQTIEQAVREDQGEPLATPVTDLERKYISGGNSWTAGQIQRLNRREAEKREANRPTGTELTQLTSKLDALTRAQGLQQVILQQQQEQLRQQQEMLDRQQQQLKQQQDALASQQEQLKQQQEQLSGVVGQQGSALESLQSLTARLDTIQNQTLQTIGVNLQTLFNRTDQLLERVQALEDRGSVGA